MSGVPGNVKQRGYWLTPKHHERLRRISFEQRISMSELIRQALDRVYFDGGEQK